MEGICMGKGIVIRINLLFGLFGTKQGAIPYFSKYLLSRQLPLVLCPNNPKY